MCHELRRGVEFYCAALTQPVAVLAGHLGLCLFRRTACYTINTSPLQALVYLGVIVTQLAL